MRIAAIYISSFLFLLARGEKMRLALLQGVVTTAVSRRRFHSEPSGSLLPSHADQYEYFSVTSLLSKNAADTGGVHKIRRLLRLVNN